MDFLEAQNYLEKVRSQKGIVLGLDTMRQEETARDQQLLISLQFYLRQELK